MNYLDLNYLSFQEPKIQPGNTAIIYGYGKMGHNVEIILKTKQVKYFICDKSFAIDEGNHITLKTLTHFDYDYVIISIKNEASRKEAEEQLIATGINRNRLLNYGDLFNEKREKDFVAAIPDSINFFDMYPEAKDAWIFFTAKYTENNVRDACRFFSIILNINHVLRNTSHGAFAELGVYKGTNAAIMSHFYQKFRRKLYLFDTFEGFDKRDLVGVDSMQSILFSDTSLEEVKKFVGDDNFIHYVKGFFPESVTEEASKEEYAFVSIDCDLYAPIKSGLEFFWPRLVKHGMIFCHDYRSGFWAGATNALDEFCSANDIVPVLLPDKSGTAVLIK